MLLIDWLYIAIFIFFSLFFPAAAITLAGIIGPKKPNALKQTIYECGTQPVGEAWIQFKVQYYIYALAFLLFDVEVIFLFPWAVAYNQLSLFAVLEGVLFILILLFGLVYVWKKDALEWS